MRDLSSSKRRRRRVRPYLVHLFLIGIGVAECTFFITPSTFIRRDLFDKDCADFATHAEAQAFYRAHGPGDPHDGIACERLP